MIRLMVDDGCSVREAAQAIEGEWLFPAGLGIQIFKRLVLDKNIVINIDEPINLNAKGVALRA
jgi:hypothetical protein